MEADIIQKTFDVRNNSTASTFQDEYLYSNRFMVPLEDESPELDRCRSTYFSKVLNKDTSTEELKERMKQFENLQFAMSHGVNEGNLSCTKYHHSDCHVGVQQKNLSITQHSDLVKHNAFSENMFAHTNSISSIGMISFLNNVQFSVDTVKQMLTDATQSLCSSSCQKVKADVSTYLTGDNGRKFLHGNKCPLLKLGYDDVNLPVLDVLANKNRIPSNKTYKCTVCHCEFTDSSQLKTHIHTGDFARIDFLKDYIKLHKGKQSSTCDYCGLKVSKGNLNRHKRVHTGDKPYKCDICGGSFTQNSSLKVHKRKHAGEKPYTCDVCQLNFSKSSDLCVHKRTHTGEKPYKCDNCGHNFSRLSNLLGHKRIHTGEKPYKCDVCGFGFLQSSHLKRHMRIHTGEKPYKCDVCGLDFIQSGQLNRHNRIHTGESPYKCDVCGNKFTRIDCLKRHMRIHREKTFVKCLSSQIFMKSCT